MGKFGLNCQVHSTAAEYKNWVSTLKQRGYRGVLHIQANHEADALAAVSLYQPYLFKALTQTLGADLEVFGNFALAGVRYCKASQVYLSAAPLHINQARAYLGTTRPLVIFNAFAGLNPNIFAMLTGCIQGGGVLVLLSPKVNEWASFDDPDYQKMSVEEPVTTSSKKRFSRYFLERGQQLFFQLEKQAPALYKTVNANDVNALPGFSNSDHVSYIPAQNIQTCLPLAFTQTVEQHTVIAQLIKQYDSIGQNNLIAAVIEGARGRGKSASVGEYLSLLATMCEASIHIIISAAHKHSLDSLLLRLDASKALNLHYSFMPLDELASAEIMADVIVIDEAAAVSTQVLKQCLSKAKQTLFITTTAGYEGNGRGFSIRFKQHLQQCFKTEQLLFLSLTQAIRYGENDPLEKLVDDWFLLDTQPINYLPNNIPIVSAQSINYCRISQQDLMANESLLQAVFGLLLEAHYQTSADDARFILDYPELEIIVACLGEVNEANIVGATLLVHEGNFNKATCDSFASTPRRLRGHILPQQLANTSAVTWLALPFLRVVRIAVLHEFRQLNIGRCLLQFTQQLFHDSWLGASFALSDDVLNFWQANDYVLIQVGLKAESSSGNVTGVVLKVPSTTLALEHKTILQLQFRFFLKDCTRRLPHLLPIKNLAFQEAVIEPENTTLLAAEIYQLKRFCAQQMSVFQVSTALASLMHELSLNSFQINIQGETINDEIVNMSSLSRLTQAASWQNISDTLYDVWVGNMSQKKAEVRLHLKGKKSWQILCREYCKIALRGNNTD